ncbi:hypothetical protein VULLAG_LOCUS19654 [Vulpes lagopus]
MRRRGRPPSPIRCDNTKTDATNWPTLQRGLSGFSVHAYPVRRPAPGLRRAAKDRLDWRASAESNPSCGMAQ